MNSISALTNKNVSLQAAPSVSLKPSVSLSPSESVSYISDEFVLYELIMFALQLKCIILLQRRPRHSLLSLQSLWCRPSLRIHLSR